MCKLSCITLQRLNALAAFATWIVLLRPISSSTIRPSITSHEVQYRTMSTTRYASSMGPCSRAPVSSPAVAPQAQPQQIAAAHASRRTCLRARRPERRCLVSCAAGDHKLPNVPGFVPHCTASEHTKCSDEGPHPPPQPTEACLGSNRSPEWVCASFQRGSAK